jgi:hypothetical protein
MIHDGIKIVRLKNGEDIIGNFHENIYKEFEITEPMVVSVVQNGNLVMSHWLPVQLIKKNEVKLNPCDVLTVFEPNEEFTEYYTNTVQKIKDLLKAKELADKMTDEEIEHIMEALEDGIKKTLH